MTRFRLLLALVMMIFLIVIGSPPGAALAADLARDTTPDAVLAIPWLTLLISTVIPLIVALLTSSTASSAVKAFVNLLLSAVTAAISAYVDSGGSIHAVDLIGTFLGVILASQVVGHALLFSHGAEQAVQRAVPGGIGGGGAPAPPGG